MTAEELIAELEVTADQLAATERQVAVLREVRLGLYRKLRAENVTFTRIAEAARVTDRSVELTLRRARQAEEAQA